MKRTGYFVNHKLLDEIKKLWSNGNELLARMKIREAAAPFGIRTGKIDMDLQTGELIVP